MIFKGAQPQTKLRTTRFVSSIPTTTNLTIRPVGLMNIVFILNRKCIPSGVTSSKSTKQLWRRGRRNAASAELFLHIRPCPRPSPRRRSTTARCLETTSYCETLLPDVYNRNQKNARLASESPVCILISTKVTPKSWAATAPRSWLLQDIRDDSSVKPLNKIFCPVEPPNILS